LTWLVALTTAQHYRADCDVTFGYYSWLLCSIVQCCPTWC